MEKRSQKDADASRVGWRLMRTQLGHQWRGLTAGVVAGLAWTAAKVAVPALVAVAIDRGIGDGSNSALLKWSLAILVAGVVAGICSGLRRWFAFREARWSEAVLRDRIFAHLQRLHFAFHDEVQTGQLMSRANTDLQQVQAFVVMIPLTISNAVTVLAAAVIMFSINPLLALLALGPLPFVNVLAKRFSSNLFPSVMAIQAESAELATVVEETVSGVRVVKGFGAESVQSAKLRSEADDVYDSSMEATRVRARYMPALELLPNIGLIVVLGYGGHLVLNGNLTPRRAGRVQRLRRAADLAAAHARQIIAQGQRAAAASGQRRTRCSRPNRRSSTIRTRDTCPSRRARPRRWARCASTRSPSATATRARASSTASTSSSSPASRSRSSARPGRARRPSLASSRASTTSTGGSVSIDGVDVRDLRVHDLRRAVGIVFEDTFLFSDTVAANIAFADPDASDEAVRARRTTGRRARLHRRSCPTATTPRSASAASRCRVGSASASRSPGRSSPTRVC